MRAMLLSLVLAAFGLASGGCSLLGEYRPVGSREAVVNDRGHVVGHREIVRLKGSDERAVRVTLYAPRLNDDGAVVGYEEASRRGAVLLDLQGRRIGNRFVDSRSQGTNPGNRGITIVFVPARQVPLALAFADPVP